MKQLIPPFRLRRAPEAFRGPVRSGFASDFEPLGGQPHLGRTAINLRWLGACLLIGVSGGGLVGTALYAAIESRGASIERPERAVIRSARSTQDTDAVGQKADQLPRGPVPAPAKKEFSAPTLERIGEREIIKTRAYVRLKTDLSLTGTGTEDIPPFDLTRAMLDETPAAPVDEASESYDPADTEATITKSDLSTVTLTDDAPALSDAEVDNQVRELIRLAADSSRLPVGFTQQRILARTFRFGDRVDQEITDRGSPESFDGIDVRIAPENMTAIPKNPAASAAPLYEEQELLLEHGETLEIALRKSGATQARTDRIMEALSGWARSNLPEGQHIRLLLGPQNIGRPIEKVTLYRDDQVQESVAENDRGAFVSVVKSDPSSQVADADAEEDDTAGISLYESVYETCLGNGVPRSVIDAMIRALAFSVDFNRRAAQGDGLSLFFSNDEGRDPELLYAAVKAGDEIRRVYRYQSPVTGEVEYLDQDGRPAKKLLMRKPVAEGRISSPFGGRFHPILGYTRPHNGVDWAAPRGTPIMATGDGIVEAAGMASGYGNHIEIKHMNGYTSGYGHLARIARGIEPGAKVKLGQVIGYVGSTGLSTGPHVHYEVKINDRFVDPMKIRLPDEQGLTGEALAFFLQEEKQTDDLRHQG